MQSTRREIMDEFLSKDPIGMPRGSLLRIDGGAGVLVHVWKGEIWLTQEGSAEDHVLGAGQSLRVDGGGTALAQAFRRSVISLSAAAPAPAGALRRFFAGLLAPLNRPDASAS
jgi:hypothetical protein